MWNEADGFDGDSQLSWLVGQLPMQELFDKYYVGELMRDPSSRDSNRGNYQRNFGYCCGHNQARRPGPMRMSKATTDVMFPRC